MPVYEYYCNTCKRTTEQIQRMSDPELERLEGCSSDHPCQLQKLFSVCGFRMGKQKEYDPPMPNNPMKGPSITRDWMNPDGTTRPMAPDEYNKNFVGTEA